MSGLAATLGAESAREITEQARKARLELSGELAKITQWSKHEDVDDAHLLALLGPHLLEQVVTFRDRRMSSSMRSRNTAL